MGKAIIYLISFLIVVFVVVGANYDWFHNPYTAKQDRSLSLNQSGQNMTVGIITLEDPPLNCSDNYGVIGYTGRYSYCTQAIGYLNRSGTNLYLAYLGDLFGLGTSNPSSMLHLVVPGATNILNISNGTQDIMFISQMNSDDTSVMIGLSNSTTNASLEIYKQSPKSNQVLFRLATSDDTNRFNVDEDGDVAADSSLTLGGDIVLGGSDIYDSSGDFRAYGEDNAVIVMDNTNNDGTSKFIVGKHTATGSVPSGENVSMVITQDNDMLLYGGLNLSNNDSLRLVDNATVWEDVNIGGILLGKGANAPTNTAWNNTIIELPCFDGATKNDFVSGCLEIPHDYVEGSNISLHAHVSPSTSTNANFTFNLTYLWTNMDGNVNKIGSFQNNSNTGSKAWGDIYIDLNDINGVGITVGSQLCFTLTRLQSNVGDNYADCVGLKTVGVHYQIDSLGSREEFSK